MKLLGSCLNRWQRVELPAGNAVTISMETVSFQLDRPQIPGNLRVRVEESSGADISWVKPESDVLAYRVYKDGSRISSSLESTTTFRDPGYSGDAVHVYEVTAIDRVGQEGTRAKVTVPPVAVSLVGYGISVEGQEALTRGFSDTIRLSLENKSSQERMLGPGTLELASGTQVFGQANLAETIVPAWSSHGVSAVIAASAALPSQAMLRASLTLPSEPWTSVTLVKSFPLAVRDPAQPVVEVFPGPLTRGALAQARVKFNNRGSAPLEVKTAVVEGYAPSSSNEVGVALKTPEGTLLSQAYLAQADNGVISRVESGKLTYFAVVEPGTSFLFDSVEVAVPEAAGVSLQVEGRVKSFTGSQSQAAVSTAAYTASVRAERSIYDQGSQVFFSGEARDQAQQLLPGATVAVRIASKGFVRTLSTTTDLAGSYRAVFDPAANEAGVYNLSASAPEAVSNAMQSSFTIVGFGFLPSQGSARLSQNSSVSLSASLVNTGETPISGLSTRLEGVPAGLSVVVGGMPNSLLAGMQAPLSLRVESSPSAPVGESTADLVVSESNGFERRLPITVEVRASQPIPRATPQAFQLGMLAGETRRQSIVLENVGFSPWESVVLSSPALAWVKVQGGSELGVIAPNGNASFGLSFEPPADLPTQEYVRNPLLEVTSANGQTIPINVGVTVTASKQGNVTFSVINADRPRDGQGKGVPVADADITLTSLDIAGLTFNAKADSNGAAAFTGVPTGQYSWRSQAEGFSVSQGVETVEPGLTTQVEVLMPTAMVTYNWSVTETTIKDIYHLTLDMTFKTDVPAPIIVVDPYFVHIPMKAGETSYTQFTVTNKGLVSAFNVDLSQIEGDSEIRIEMPFTKIPELKPGQTVEVPVIDLCINNGNTLPV